MRTRMIWSVLLPIAILAAACGGSPASSTPANEPGMTASTDEPAEKVAEVASAGGAGEFTFSGRMTDARSHAADVLLPDGRVLVFGGVSKGGVLWGPVGLDTATIWDSATGEWTDTGGMAKERQ